MGVKKMGNRKEWGRGRWEEKRNGGEEDGKKTGRGVNKKGSKEKWG
jgi:hypothetical protein